MPTICLQVGKISCASDQLRKSKESSKSRRFQQMRKLLHKRKVHANLKLQKVCTREARSTLSNLRRAWQRLGDKMKNCNAWKVYFQGSFAVLAGVLQGHFGVHIRRERIVQVALAMEKNHMVSMLVLMLLFIIICHCSWLWCCFVFIRCIWCIRVF